MSNYLNNNQTPNFTQPPTATLTDDGSYPSNSRYNDINVSDYVPLPDVKDKETIKAFQDWLDLYHPEDWTNSGKPLNKSKGYGNLGDQTQDAWYTYGKEFLGRVPNWDRANSNPSAVGFPNGFVSEEDQLLNNLYLGI